MQDMYDLTRGHTSDWGLEGYEVPVNHFDSVKKKYNDDMYLINIGKKKKPRPGPVNMEAKRGGIFREIERYVLYLTVDKQT